MRVTSIAFAVFIISLSVSSIQAWYGLSATANYNLTVEMNTSLAEQVNSSNVGVWSLLWSWEFWNQMLTGLLKGVFMLGAFINDIIPIPPAAQIIISAAVDIIYLWGFIQFVTGRSGGMYE